MAEYIYRLEPTRMEMVTEAPTEKEAKILDEHLHYLQRLAHVGVVELAGRTTSDDIFGIVIFRAADDDGARQIVAGDPAVGAGVMRAELHPFRLAVRSGSS